MSRKLNLLIDQGTSFEKTIDLTEDDPVANTDLSTYDATSKIKKTFTSLTSISFTVTANEEANTITLSLTPGQTANLSGGQYLYDTYLANTSSNTAYRVFEGIVTLNPQVSK